jgi:hypothetical protein
MVDLAGYTTYVAFEQSIGSWAMSQSVNLYDLQTQSIVPPNTYLDEYGEEKEITGVKQVGDKAFYNKNDQWVDGEYTDDLNTLKVKIYSEAYFQLSARFREINTYLALGEEVIIILNNNAIQIGTEGRQERFTEAELDLLGPVDEL